MTTYELSSRGKQQFIQETREKEKHSGWQEQNYKVKEQFEILWSLKESYKVFAVVVCVCLFGVFFFLEYPLR